MIKKLLLISIGKHTQNASAGIDQIAYYLRNKTDLKIDIDIMYYDFREPDLRNKVLPLGYDIYGFYLDRITFFDVIGMAKQAKDDSKIVVFGGLFPSIMYKDIIEYTPFVDYIVCGDGEVPLEFLLRTLMEEEYDKIDTYDYIASRHSNRLTKKMYKNTEVSVKTADDFYQKRQDTTQSFELTLMIKSNACSHHCTFCLSNKTNCNFRFRTLENIMGVIEEKIKKFNINHLYFSDNDFFDGNYELHGLKKVNEICDAIQMSDMKNISFSFSTRVDATCFNPKHKSILQKMKDIGLSHIFLGIESGNDDDLKLYGKGVTAKKSISTIRLLSEYDIYPTLGFIMLNPYSNFDRLYTNLLFLKEVKSVSLGNYARGQLVIEKYSALYFKANKDNLLKEKYSFITPSEYYYVNKDMNEISLFLSNHFEKEETIGGEFDPVHNLCVYYYILKRKHIELKKYEKDVVAIKNRFVEVTFSYFEMLYKNGDIRACENKYSNYKSDLLDIDKECNRIRRGIYRDVLRLE